MDEDDSQDELINRSASHSKGKRPALWAISDDSDDAEEQSDEGETDSGEEEEGDEDPLGGEDDESDDDDDDDEEEEEEDSGKALEGAVGGISADLTGVSSDEDGEKCPICLNSFHSQPVATPESCEHYFCLDCILEWSKNANSCPVDRIVFNNIYLRKCFGGKVQKMITVQKPVKEGQEGVVLDLELEQTSCEVCGGRDREDRLLLCDGCDAGYHMECLTPPLDAVPVEEWFCPECEANNRRSRGSAEELSETDSLPGARPTTSRPRPSAAGPTRAIARTQQSERVRANVNRHRITQARTARTARTEQFTPRFLMQSTWLDETINAVVAGLNTAVYVRDLTPRAPSSRRRRTVRRRKGSGKRASSAKGEKGKAAGTGVKRRRRKVRRKKSRRRLVVKKQPTSRGRIAHSLGIAKPKKGTTLPTVCRPSEQSLGSMRADIGAASFSIYGDPFGLDPFDYAEDEEQQVTSLLDAKRRGLSRSALRSHQPVARPITAGLSRQGMSLPQSEEVAVAAPVPDLLGSILSGQSMLLMDSSEVVINRDGSLKAMKPVSLPSLSSGRSGSSSGETSAQVTPGMSPVPGPTFSPSVRPTSSSQSSPGPCLSPLLPCSPPPASHSHPAPHLQPPNRPSPASALSQRGINGMGSHRGTTPNSTQPNPDSGSRGRDAAPSQSQGKKAAPKPVWVDVAVLPRIPKLKRESGSLANGGSGSTAGGSASNGLPKGAGVHNLAGDRARQHTVDQKQQQQQQQQQGQRSQSGRAAPSPAFSSSFSSSTSSSSGSPASLLRSSSSSSSATVSFRIAGGSSWHSRRLGNTSSVLDGVGSQEDGTSEDEEAKRKRERRNKHFLSDSHNQGVEEEQNTYDPFNPTGSDSNFSDSEAENQSQYCNSQNAPTEAMETGLGNEDGPGHQVKTETVETRISGELDQGSGQHREVKKDPEPSDTEEGERSSRHSPQSASKSGESDTKPSRPASLLPIKKESTGSGDKNGQNVPSLSGAPSHRKTSTSCSGNSQHSQGRGKIKSEPKDSPTSSKSRSRSPARPSGPGKKASKGGGSSRERRSASSSPDGGRRRGERHGSGQGSRRRDGGGGGGGRGGEENRDRRSRPSDSRERWRKTTRSSSSSSDSDASEKYRRKKGRSRSRSKDRRRSRSGSDSSSRGRSRRTKQKPGGSRERIDSGGRERDRGGRAPKDQRRGRSHSRSRSRERRKEHPRPPQPSSSGSKNRPEDRPKDRRRARSRSRSRSRSQERRKEGPASKSFQKTPSGWSTAYSSKQLPEATEKKRARDAAGGSLKEERDVREKKREVPSSSWAPKEKAPVRLPEVKVEKDLAELRSDSRVPSEKPTKAPKVDKEIKKEKISSFDIFEDSPVIKSLGKEPTETASPGAVKDEREHHQVKKEELDPVQDNTCALTSEDKGIKKEQVSSSQVKAEPIWTELSEQPSPTAPPFSPATPEGSPCSPCSPYSPGSPGPQAANPTDCLGEASSDPPPAPKAPAAGSSLGQRSALAKPADEVPCDSEDEDFNVDMMLDSLDFVRPAGVPTGADEGVAGVKREAEVKTEGGQVAVAAGAKSKATVKRVTWNITEPTEPHPQKSASKLALYKLKLKQEAARRPNFTQPSKKDGADVGVEGGDPVWTGAADAGDLEAARMCPVYLKKLHMQERAVEEVKLAIKPFYRNREITKEEYKDILRKAVQKVCHSKSGEISPVKVANLVKAYVEKYKHARKHKKGEDGQNKQEADRDSDSQ